MAQSNGDDLKEHLLAEYGFKESDPVFMKMMSDIRLFSEVDRKQHELDARIDELLHLDDESIGTDWKANAWFSVSDRIAELNAERERLGN